MIHPDHTVPFLVALYHITMLMADPNTGDVILTEAMEQRKTGCHIFIMMRDISSDSL